MDLKGSMRIPGGDDEYSTNDQTPPIVPLQLFETMPALTAPVDIMRFP